MSGIDNNSMTINFNHIIKIIAILSVTFGAASLNFILQSLYASRLSVNEYGRLAFYLNFIMLITPIVGAGVPNFWIKANAKYENGLSLWIRPSISFIQITFIITIFIQIFFFINYVNEDKLAYWLLSSFMISQISISFINAINIIDNNTREYVFWRLYSPLVRLILFIFLVAINQINILNISLIYFITSIIPILFFYKEISNIPAQSKAQFGILDIFNNSWMYSLSGIIYMMYLQGSSVLIKHFFSFEYVAIYNIPILFLTAVLMFPSIIFQRVYISDLNKLFYNDADGFVFFLKKSLLSMSIFGIVFCVAFYFISPVLVDIFFGEKYNDSIEIIKILSYVIPFAFITSVLSAVHIKKNHLLRKFWIMLIVLVIHVLIICLTNEIIGFEIFAYTTVLSYALVCILLGMSTHNIIKNRE